MPSIFIFNKVLSCEKAKLIAQQINNFKIFVIITDNLNNLQKVNIVIYEEKNYN